MEYIRGIFTNYVLVCAVAGWFVAHAMKCVILFKKNKEFSFAVLTASGGMPSSHSAIVCAAVTSCAKCCGAASPEFALAAILAFIVMYDSSGVRRAAGAQAKVLNRVVSDLSGEDNRYLNEKLKENVGHTPLEVLIGALIGLIVPIFIPVF